MPERITEVAKLADLNYLYAHTLVIKVAELDLGPMSEEIRDTSLTTGGGTKESGKFYP